MQGAARQDVEPSREHASHDPDGQWMGQRETRRLLIIGAMAVVMAAVRRGVPSDADGKSTWLSRMLAKKPRMLVAIALANKMARGPWAMRAKEQNHRDPAVTAA